VRAVKFVKSGDPSMEAWHAPELDCAEIKRLARFSGCCKDRPGADVGPKTSELRFISAALGDPDPALFDVSQLSESIPSQAMGKILRKQGHKEEYIQRQKDAFLKADAVYMATRAAAGVFPDSKE
jgi:hypothetical protein